METKSTSVRREIFIEASVDIVWNALTKSEERNLWETRSCSLDIKVGGKVTFDYGWGVSSTGTIIELVPYKRMTIEDEQNDLTIWTLSPEGNGTRVAVEYTALWLGDQGHMIMDNMAFGTMQFLRNLKSVLELKKDLRETFWRSWLCISHTSIRPDHYAKYGVKHGALVLQVKSETAISKLLYPEDIIIEVNGKQVAAYEDLELALTEVLPDETVSLKIVRHGHTDTIQVPVSPYPVAYSA